MRRAKISQELLNQLAEAEAQALVDAMNDADLRQAPAILGAVRRFLKDNKLIVQEDTPSVQAVKRKAEELPDFDFGNGMEN